MQLTARTTTKKKKEGNKTGTKRDKPENEFEIRFRRFHCVHIIPRVASFTPKTRKNAVIQGSPRGREGETKSIERDRTCLKNRLSATTLQVSLALMIFYTPGFARAFNQNNIDEWNFHRYKRSERNAAAFIFHSIRERLRYYRYLTYYACMPRECTCRFNTSDVLTVIARGNFRPKSLSKFFDRIYQLCKSYEIHIFSRRICATWPSKRESGVEEKERRDEKIKNK